MDQQPGTSKSFGFDKRPGPSASVSSKKSLHGRGMQTPGMVQVRFRAMKRTDQLRLFVVNKGQQANLQVWYNFFCKPPKPYFEPFNYPIKTIKFISADDQVVTEYDELLNGMNQMYGDLYDRFDYKDHVLQSEEIIAGTYAVGKSCALREDIRAVAYGNYQRVRILETFGSRNPPSHVLKCMCVDQGNVVYVDFRELFYITEDYARLPPKIIEVPLTGLEDRQMSTDLRNVLLNELFLHSSIITLRVDGDDLGIMTSSRFPDRNFIEVIREKVEQARKDPGRVLYKIEDKMDSFTSLVPIRTTGLNFGPLKEPPVYLHVGARLDMVVIGFGGPAELRIIPYTTFKSELFKNFDIEKYLSDDWMSHTEHCQCIKDGTHFIVRRKHCIERCQLLQRCYKNYMNDQRRDPAKKVKVLLLDKAEIATVHSGDIIYMPPSYAEFLPAQAVVAFWTAPGPPDNGAYNWMEREWEAFGRFAMHNRFIAIVNRMRQDNKGLNFVHLDLYNPSTNEKLDPRTHFWLESKPRNR